MANNSQSDGTFSRDVLPSRDQTGAIILKDPEHMKFLLHGDKLAWQFIRQNPTDFAILVLRKWRIFFDAFTLGWTQWNWPGGLTGFRRPVDVFVPYSNAGLYLLLPLSLLGLFFCMKVPGNPRSWAILVLMLSCAGLFITGIFFGYVRQGLLLIPFWLTLTASGIICLVNWIKLIMLRKRNIRDLSSLPSSFRRPKHSRSLLTILAIIAAILLLIEGLGSQANRDYQAKGLPIAGTRALNPDTEVHLNVRPDR